MANDVIRKDLGEATAYAYAVSKGYTGTEEEFAELMASYATVAEDAAQSAQEAADEALVSEGHASGTQDKVPVSADSPYYHNNAAYFADQADQSAQAASGSAGNASDSAGDAATQALKSEGYAAGTQNGSSVGSDSPYYHNNASYWNTQAQGEASAAAGSATFAEGYSKDSQAWSEGVKGSTPVTSDDPQCQNNAKYWATQAAASAATSAAMTGLADQFDATKNYAVGDYVLYNGTFYKFTAAHPSGAWTGTDVVADTAGAELTSLLSQLEATQIVNEASGAVASFADGADGVPVRDLVVNIDPVQSGSGDPAPDNVRPITGWTGAKVTGASVNIFGGNLMRDGIKATISTSSVDLDNKTITFSSNASTVGAFTNPSGLTGKFKPNTQYTFIITYEKTSGSASSNMRIVYTDGSATSIPGVTANNTKETKVVVTTSGKTVWYFNKQNNSGNTKVYYDESGIFEGVLTAANFVPYQGNTYAIDWTDEAGTVYGGSLDVTTGVLTVTHKSFTFDSGFAPSETGTVDKCVFATYTPADMAQSTVENWAKGYKSNILSLTVRGTSGSAIVNGSMYAGASYLSIRLDSVPFTQQGIDDFLTATPLQIVAPIKTPLTVQLDPVTVATLLGQNNIWADTGDVEVQYVADPKLFIEQLTVPDADMVADANITSGSYFMVGNTLYLATANIANGAAIVPGTNCTRTNLAAALNAINS